MRTLPSLGITTVFTSVVLAGCATGPFGRVSESAILYPSPPDTARIQFLFSFANERDVKGRSGGFLSTFLDEDPDVRSISKPYGVAVNRGRFYVCDSMLPGVVVADMQTRTFRQWQPGGLLENPIACAVDPSDGSLFVADTERWRVAVFDSTLQYRGDFGSPEDRAFDVFVGRDRIYLADLRVSQVRVFDKTTGELLRSFPAPSAPAAERIAKLNGLWVRDGMVYVTDFGAAQVKVYREDGTFVRAFGSMGTLPGQFLRPKGIAVDRSGIIYVVDAAFQNVQVFDQEGAILMAFGGGHNGPGGMSLPAQVSIVDEDLESFEEYVAPGFELEYVIIVTNQYGPNRVSAYGFVRPATARGS